MFEKEAQEYTCLNARQYIHNDAIGFCTNQEEVRQAYQNGADFGYNKCREQLTKAKELIKEMLSILPKENIEGVYEITEEAEQFIRGVKEK